MSDVVLSPGAMKMLKHFRDQGLGQRAFELPAELETLFDKPEECEAVQAELAGHDLLELGMASHPSEPTRIRSAALTLDGVRFLKNGE